MRSTKKGKGLEHESVSKQLSGMKKPLFSSPPHPTALEMRILERIPVMEAADTSGAVESNLVRIKSL